MDELTLKTLPAYLKKANQCRESDALEEAFALMQPCLAQFPQDPDVQCLYGLIQHDRKHYFDAEKAFNTAITLMPDKADYYCFLGDLHKNQRRFREAEKNYQQCLKYNPKHLYATFHLAQLYDVENRLLEATRLYKKVIARDPTFQKAYYHLAVIYHKQGQLEAAIQHYQKAVALDPTDVASLSNLGATYTRDRQFTLALPCFERVLALNPQHLGALSNLASTYIEMNDLKKAHTYMTKALAIDPKMASNWRNLTLCKRFTLNDREVLDKLLAFVNEPGLIEEDRIHYDFALGKIYHDLHEYDKAFPYYQQANTLQAKKSVFDSVVFGEHIQRIIKVMDSVALPSLNRPNTPDECQPLLIIGTARSGKSLLEALLLQSPMIGGVGELGIADLPNQLPMQERPKTNYPYWLRSMSADQFLAIREVYLQRLTRNSPDKFQYMIDTMPGNFLYLGLIGYLFPRAKIIHCQRDPMDACLLMYFKYFIEGHGYSYDLGRLGRYYQEYLEMMDYWRQRSPQNIMEVPYETLVTKPEETLKAVMTFLALDPNERFDVSKVHANECGIWRHYEQYLQPLKTVLAESAPIPVKVIDETVEEMKALLGNAYLSFQHGDLDMAEILCHTLLEADPQQYAVLHLLGLVYYFRDELDKSVNILERSAALDPSVIQLHIDLARIYYELGDRAQLKHQLSLVEMLQAKKSNTRLLDNELRKTLLSAFKQAPEVIDESESRLLLLGNAATDVNAATGLVPSKERYFTDLSFGSFRRIQGAEKGKDRIDTWHFLYQHLALVDNILNQTKSVIRIGDIGCAAGYLRRFLEGNLDPKDTKKLVYWGLDKNRERLESAVKGIEIIDSGAEGNLIPSAYIVHDVQYGLPFQDHYFDFLVNFEMLNHVSLAQGKALLAEMHRVLNPKGLLYLSTTRREFDALLQENGFEILARRGSQANIQRLLPHIPEAHGPLVQDLLKVHPPEMVAAMLSPLYPDIAPQITFICKRA